MEHYLYFAEGGGALGKPAPLAVEVIRKRAPTAAEDVNCRHCLVVAPANKATLVKMKLRFFVRRSSGTELERRHRSMSRP